MCEDVHGQCTIYIVYTVHVHVHVLDALFESTCTETKRCMVLDNIHCKFVDMHVLLLGRKRNLLECRAEFLSFCLLRTLW